MGGDRFHEVGEGTQANQGACVSLEDCQAYNQQVRDCEAFNQMVRDWEQMSAAGFENLVVIVGCNNTIAPNSTLEQYALKLIESELARAAEEDPALYAYLSDAIHVEAGEGDERRLLIEQVEHMIAQENSQMFDPDGDGVFNYNNFRAGASLCLPYLTGLNELSEFQESNPGERYRDCGEEIDCTPWVPTNDGQQGSGSGGGSGDQGDDDHGSDQPIDDHSDEPGEDSGEESDEDSGEEECYVQR